MIRGFRDYGRRFTLVAVLVGVLPHPCPGQPGIRRAALDGSLTLGWVDSKAQERQQTRLNNLFFGLDLRYRSFVLHPDFISYDVRPKFGGGFQGASGGGNSMGNGLEASFNFLRKRPWPLTVSFFRLDRQFLSTAGQSSFARITSDAEDSGVGVTWGYHVEDQPRFDVEFNNSSNAFSPDSGLIPGSHSGNRSLSLRGEDHIGDWQLNGNLGLSSSNSLYSSAQEVDVVLPGTDNDRRTATLRASRVLGENSRLRLRLDRRFVGTRFDEREFSNHFTVLDAQWEYRPSERLRLTSQANLARTAFQGETVVPVGPDQRRPGGLVGEVLDTGFNLGVRYRPNANLSVHLRSEFTHLDSDQSFASRGNVLNNVGGLDYNLSRGLLFWRSSYSLAHTRTALEPNPSSRFLGHNLENQLTVGDLSTLQVSAGATLFSNRSRQVSLLTGANRGQRARLSIGRYLWGNWQLRVQGETGWSRSEFLNSRSEFRTKAYSLTLSGSRLSLFFSRSNNRGSGGTLLVPVDVPGGSPGDLPDFPLVGSSTNFSSVGSLQLRLLQNLGLKGTWSDFAQTAGTFFDSKVRRREALLTWRLRRVQIEAGYNHDVFEFVGLAFRKQWVIRVIRHFRLF